MKNLGFGMMRLPVIDGEPTNFNYEVLNKMVDACPGGAVIPAREHDTLRWLLLQLQRRRFLTRKRD